MGPKPKPAYKEHSLIWPEPSQLTGTQPEPSLIAETQPNPNPTLTHISHPDIT